HGDVALGGMQAADVAPVDLDIAMVFQSYALYPNMTVAGNIAFGMEIRGVPKEERAKAIAQVSDMLQIGHLLDSKPSQ
ncbi:sugar ABC transporter ATP-binding protein, partial [Rhizobium ruizarguesonis]